MHPDWTGWRPMRLKRTHQTVRTRPCSGTSTPPTSASTASPSSTLWPDPSWGTASPTAASSFLTRGFHFFGTLPGDPSIRTLIAPVLHLSEMAFLFSLDNNLCKVPSSLSERAVQLPEWAKVCNEASSLWEENPGGRLCPSLGCRGQPDWGGTLLSSSWSDNFFVESFYTWNMF